MHFGRADDCYKVYPKFDPTVSATSKSPPQRNRVASKSAEREKLMQQIKQIKEEERKLREEYN